MLGIVILSEIKLSLSSKNDAIENYPPRIDLVVHVSTRCSAQRIPKIHPLFVGFSLLYFDGWDFQRMCSILHTICISRFDRVALCSDQYYCKHWHCLWIHNGLSKSQGNQHDFQKFVENLSSSYVMASYHGNLLIKLMSISILFLGQNTNSYEILTNTNNKCEWMWKLYFYFLIYVVMSTYSMSATSMLLRWMTHGDLEIEYFYHPVKLMSVKTQIFFPKVRLAWNFKHFSHSSLPWDQSTYLGYFAEISFNALNFLCFVTANGAFFLLFMFMSYHHQAFYDIFKHSMAEIDCCSDANEFNKKSLCDFIEYHVSIKA